LRTKTEKIEGLNDKVRDELIVAFCQECEDHDADESSCADHTCVVYACLTCSTNASLGIQPRPQMTLVPGTHIEVNVAQHPDQDPSWVRAKVIEGVAWGPLKGYTRIQVEVHPSAGGGSVEMLIPPYINGLTRELQNS